MSLHVEAICLDIIRKILVAHDVCCSLFKWWSVIGALLKPYWHQLILSKHQKIKLNSFGALLELLEPDKNQLISKNIKNLN